MNAEQPPSDPSGDTPTVGAPKSSGAERETVTIDVAPAQAAVGLQPGDSVGPYKLLEVIGLGGFGVVWLAEQREPLRRRVALKVIKPGMDSASVLARFEAEQTALSVMDHPNIARVLDGGTTDRGLPYFVMEYVPGEPVTDYCRRRKLSLNARIDVFVQVCQAVQHAHAKGVIHRDLKPSNILVREQDDKPVAKVIDFGVAKALDQRLSQKTLFTAHGHIVGTPEYMAPEQAEGSGQDIDTRADVYSLGVTLYELLTGHRPFDLRDVAWNELNRVLSEVEPPKPSTRLLATLDRRSDAASMHETRSTVRALKSDLDWVVMRCLAKERSRRYQTAAALADDLGRFLAGEPVTAGPPTVGYRLGKFAKKHRAGIALTGAVSAAVVIAAVVAAAGWARALENERRAKETLISIVRGSLRQEWASEDLVGHAEAAGIELLLKEDGTERRFYIDVEGGDEIARLAAFAERLFLWATAASDEANRALLQQQGLRSFLFEQIVEAARSENMGKSLTVIDAVLAAISKIDEYGLDDETAIGMRSDLAVVLFDAGLDLEALEHARTADRLYTEAGIAPPAMLYNRATIAGALSRSGSLDEAERIYAELVPLAEERLGRTHGFTLAARGLRAVNLSRSGDFAAALQQHERLVELRTEAEGADSRGALSSRVSAGHARVVLASALPTDAPERSTNLSRAHAIMDDLREAGVTGNVLHAASSLLVQALVESGNFEEAVLTADEWLGATQGELAENASVRVAVRHHRARALVASNAINEGVAELFACVSLHREQVGPSAPPSRTEVVMWGQLVVALERVRDQRGEDVRRAFLDLDPLDVISERDPARAFVVGLVGSDAVP